MNKVVFALFALVAVAAAYRPHRIENEEDAPHYEPRYRHQGMHHGGMRHHGMPHHLLTVEVVNAVMECKQEAWKRYQDGDQSEDGVGCLIACVMQKIGEMNENGKLNEKKIIQDIQAKAQLEEKIARSCIAEIHADESNGSCQTAGSYLRCVMKKAFDLHNNE